MNSRPGDNAYPRQLDLTRSTLRRLAPNVTFQRRSLATPLSTNSQLGAHRYFQQRSDNGPQSAAQSQEEEDDGDDGDESGSEYSQVFEIDLGAPADALEEARHHLFRQEHEARRREGRSPPHPVQFVLDREGQPSDQPDDVFLSQFENGNQSPTPLDPLPDHSTAIQSQINDLYQTISQLQNGLINVQSQGRSSQENKETRRRAERKELATYSGDEPFREWWLNVVHLKDRYNWSDKEMLSQAIARLRGNAIETYQAEKLSQDTPVERFKEVMGAICRHETLDHTIHSRIRNAAIKPEEKVQTFVADLSSLFNQLKERMSEEAKISSLIDGVCHKFEASTCQSARLQGSFARAARYLVEVEGYQQQRDSRLSNQQSLKPSYTRNDRKLFQPRGTPQATQATATLAKNTSQVSKDTPLYCDRHASYTDHSAETCHLTWCDHHGWKTHVTRECRNPGGKRKLANNQATPQNVPATPYFRVKEVKSSRKRPRKNFKSPKVQNQQPMANSVNQVTFDQSSSLSKNLLQPQV